MRVSHLRQGTDPCPLVRIRARVRYHWSVQAPPQHNPSESRPRQSPSSAWALATLLVITALGLTFRLWDLGTLPPSPDPDELSIGYNAWSILETGRDEFGTPYPTAFRAFGEYKRPAFIYAAVPSIALFGPTTWAIRLPGAIAGTLTVPVLYALAVSLFGNRAIGLLAATGLAFSPWHLQFSRGAREAAFITLAVTLLALCLTRATTLILGTPTTGVLPRRVHVWAAGAALAMLLAMYSYPGGVVFTPLMVGASAWILRSHLRRTALSWVIAIAIVGVGAFPLARQLLDGRVGARFAQASLLNDVDLQKLATKRIERDVQLGIPWILDHPYALAARRAVDAYAGHFNPTYLFTRGDDQPRHHGTDTGQLYLWDAPLILAGLVILARRRTHPAYQFTGLWLLIGPVPASLATEAPHAVRSIVMLPAWYLAGGIGAVAIWNRLRTGKQARSNQFASPTITSQVPAWRRRVAPVIAGVYLSLLVPTVTYYAWATTRYYSLEYAPYWLDGTLEAFAYAQSRVDDGTFRHVVIPSHTQAIYLYALWETRYAPSRYLGHGGTGQSDRATVAPLRFDPFEQRVVSWPDEPGSTDTLYAFLKIDGRQPPSRARIIHSVRDHRGEVRAVLFTLGD
ncbi:MAG: phospholipid carrier-dependent glycosyltransferase [Proteobacteria bacterium]|nr:phospholipid carrier-dependent glycosyltransferase [Pseudomonadota bacterium]